MTHTTEWRIHAPTCVPCDTPQPIQSSGRVQNVLSPTATPCSIAWPASVLPGATVLACRWRSTWSIRRTPTRRRRPQPPPQPPSWPTSGYEEPQRTSLKASPQILRPANNDRPEPNVTPRTYRHVWSGTEGHQGAAYRKVGLDASSRERRDTCSTALQRTDKEVPGPSIDRKRRPASATGQW